MLFNAQHIKRAAAHMNAGHADTNLLIIKNISLGGAELFQP